MSLKGTVGMRLGLSCIHLSFLVTIWVNTTRKQRLAQGYEIVRVFKPSDPEDTYVNMIYTNVLFLILFDCRERNVQRQDETEPPMSVSFVHRLPAFLKIPSSKQRCVIMKWLRGRLGCAIFLGWNLLYGRIDLLFAIRWKATTTKRRRTRCKMSSCLFRAFMIPWVPLPHDTFLSLSYCFALTKDL